MSQPQHIHTYCNATNNFTQSSAYETNRNILLISLAESSSLGTYSNATNGLIPNTVFGMFLCRGDINATSCSECVKTAATEMATNCTLNKRAIIYYQECMVRYSDVSFFSLLEFTPNIVAYSNLTAPNPNRFNQTLSDKFNKLIPNVASSSLIPYFVPDFERVTQEEGSYELESMVQCSPDLDQFNCTVCLLAASLRVSSCCGLPSFAQVFTPKCVLGYRTSVLPSAPLSPTSSPPLSLPPLSAPTPFLSQTPPPNVPSGSFSFNVIKGNEIFGRIVVVAMTALVFAIVNQ